MLAADQFYTDQRRSPANRSLVANRDLVWSLARNFTTSDEEAAAASREMFADIRRYTKRVDWSPEDQIVSIIALRRLCRHLRGS